MQISALKGKVNSRRISCKELWECAIRKIRTNPTCLIIIASHLLPRVVWLFSYSSEMSTGDLVCKSCNSTRCTTLVYDTGKVDMEV